MKKLFFAAAIALVSFVGTAFGKDANPGSRAKEAFAQKFNGAQQVTWSEIEGYDKAAFIIGGTRAEAYFTKDGELVGSVRNLIFSQLPLTVMQAVNNQFSGAAVTEITEVNNSEGTGYRIKFELKDKKYSVKFNSLGFVTDLKKSKIGK